MKLRLHPFARITLLLATLACGNMDQALAQFPGGFGGGIPGGFGGGGGTRSSQRQYPNNTGIGDATITVNQETRKVIVVTDEDTNNNIKEVIASLDQPKPQVLIKVVFLEVTYNNTLDFGVEGTYKKNVGGSFMSGMMTNFGVVSNNIVPLSLTPAKNGNTVSAANSFGLAGSQAPTGLYQMLGKDFEVTVKAIAGAGKAEILSRPSILARNGQPATITIGQQVPLISGTRYDTLGNQLNTVTYQNVGIILKVTPFITPDGMVEMIVQPETSQLADRSQWVPISSGPGGSITAPVINTRSADTVVVVPDSQTVIIGGLMERLKNDVDSKIPILGDIPGLGWLFSHKTKNNTKTELMIFLTPHVVQAPSQLAAVTETERTVNKGMTEQEMQRFLDGLPVKDADKSKDKDKGSKTKK
jgi:general secretion pathway protein D